MKMTALLVTGMTMLLASSALASTTDSPVVELLSVARFVTAGTAVELPKTKHADGNVCAAYISAVTISENEKATVTTDRFCGSATTMADGLLGAQSIIPTGLRRLDTFAVRDGVMIHLPITSERVGDADVLCSAFVSDVASDGHQLSVKTDRACTKVVAKGGPRSVVPVLAAIPDTSFAPTK